MVRCVDIIFKLRILVVTIINIDCSVQINLRQQKSPDGARGLFVSGLVFGSCRHSIDGSTWRQVLMKPASVGKCGDALLFM